MNIVQPALAVLQQLRTFSSSSSSSSSMRILSSANYMSNCLRVKQNITSTRSCLVPASATPQSANLVPANSQRWHDVPQVHSRTNHGLQFRSSMLHCKKCSSLSIMIFQVQDIKKRQDGSQSMESWPLSWNVTPC